jgi:putative hemolysin
VKAPEVFLYSAEITAKPDLVRANAAMPPLLRSYLMMGGWVSGHAVIDRTMNTLHVFTALDIGAIPPARKKLLRALV